MQRRCKSKAVSWHDTESVFCILILVELKERVLRDIMKASIFLIRKESLEYHEYIVTQDIDVECIVMKGFAAPGFESNGGAIQYKHNEQIIRLIRKGILVEDFVWLSRMKKN